MPTAFKIVKDVPVNWAVPGGGVTWDATDFADPGDITLSSGNGVVGFTVGKTGTYAVHLGPKESLGSADGGIWSTLADADSGTVALTASQQYYIQGPTGNVRQAKMLLAYRLVISSSSSSDSGNVYIRGLDINGVDVNETLTLSGISDVASSNYYEKIVSISKDATTGSVKVSDAQGYWFRMAPTQTQSLFTRLEFDTTPTETKTATVVYKQRVRDLLSDGDAPQINSIDQALMAFALGDLYTKQRQLSKAAVKYEEAVNLLNVVRERETVQQANNIVLQPDNLGHYNADDFGWG